MASDAWGGWRKSEATFDFLKTLYSMVDDPTTDSTISWSPNGKSFIVWNWEEFARNFLPRLRAVLYSCLNFATRIDRLGVSKVENSEHEWEFANDDFVKGQPELLKKIWDRDEQRRKAFYDQRCKQMRSTCKTLEECFLFMEERKKERERRTRANALANDLQHQCNI